MRFVTTYFPVDIKALLLEDLSSRISEDINEEAVSFTVLIDGKNKLPTIEIELKVFDNGI